MRAITLVSLIALFAPAASAQDAAASPPNFVSANLCQLTTVLKLLEINRRPGTVTNTSLLLASASRPTRYARCTFINRSTALLCEVPTGWIAASPPLPDKFRQRDRELGEFADHGFTRDPLGGDHRRVFSSPTAELDLEKIARWMLTLMASVYRVQRTEDLDIRIAGADMTLLGSLLPLECGTEGAPIPSP